MSPITKTLTDIYLRITGYTYSNLARLFVRLFVGVMFLQFGIRQLVNYETLRYSFPSVGGLTPETTLILMITVELVCSLCIMVGFLTRLATIPPIVSMIAAEYYIIHDLLGDLPLAGLDSTGPGFLPIMFIGFYFFLLLAGPGKISVDYGIALLLIERQNRDEKEELEEM